MDEKEKWRFRVFLDGEGRCDFTHEWQRNLPPEAKTRWRWIVKTMKGLKNWPNTGYIEPLTGYDGIFEIKFRAGRVVYRPLGCYAPNQSFILLLGAKEHGDRLEPINAAWKAMKNKQALSQNRGTTREYY